MKKLPDVDVAAAVNVDVATQADVDVETDTCALAEVLQLI